jgi:hypothetical protein
MSERSHETSDHERWNREVKLSTDLSRILDDDFDPSKVALQPGYTSAVECDLAQLFSPSSDREIVATQALFGVHKCLEGDVERPKWYTVANNPHNQLIVSGVIHLLTEPGWRVYMLLQLMAVLEPVRMHYIARCNKPVPLGRQRNVNNTIMWVGLATLRNECTPREFVHAVFNALMFNAEPNPRFKPR